jgi:hypothetical protein
MARILIAVAVAEGVVALAPHNCVLLFRRSGKKAA